jgi:hypothetical protein
MKCVGPQTETVVSKSVDFVPFLQLTNGRVLTFEMVLYSCFIMFKFTHLDYGTSLEESRHCVRNYLFLQLKRVNSYEHALEVYDVHDGVRI